MGQMSAWAAAGMQFLGMSLLAKYQLVKEAH